MRFYYRPPRSNWGISTGFWGAVAARYIAGGLWILLFSFCMFFVWPFQFIWQWLPHRYPNREGLAGLQALLTAGWIGVLVAMIVLGSNVHGLGPGSGPLLYLRSACQSSYGQPVPLRCVDPSVCDHDGGVVRAANYGRDNLLPDYTATCRSRSTPSTGASKWALVSRPP